MEFNESVDMISIDEIKEKASPWGNSLYYITEKQLEELKNGKVIWTGGGEYCQFIALKK